MSKPGGAKRSSLLATRLPHEPSPETETKPDYSIAALRQLQGNSTPSAAPTSNNGANNPSSTVDQVASSTQSLNLTSKFGADMSRYSKPTPIPSSTEIAEKKARRARLAKRDDAADYISLDPEYLENYDMDEENMAFDAAGKMVLKSVGDKYGIKESRLAKDDEDIMEGFAEMEDGSLALGDGAERAEAKKKRGEMAALIADAEGAEPEWDEEDESDSERERMDAFDAAQTRYATGKRDVAGSGGPPAPPRIAPLPSFDGALERLRRQMEEMRVGREEQLREIELLRQERAKIGEEEERIQNALRETAEYYEKLRAEKGIGQNGSALTTTNGTPSLAADGQQEADESGEGDEGAETPRPGLGMGSRGRGLDEFGVNAGLGARAAMKDAED